MSGNNTPAVGSNPGIDPKVFADAVSAAVTAAMTQMIAAQQPPQPVAAPFVLPQFVHDAAKPNGAALWFARIESTLDRHKVEGKEKVAITLEALDSATYEKVSQALLPDQLLGFEEFDKLKSVMITLFDYTQSVFAKRYAIFNTVWKGPEHESIAEVGARIRQQATNFDTANFKQPQLETMLLLMCMRDPGLDGFRTKVLNLLNDDPDTTLETCLKKMSAAYQTQREQRLPTNSSVNFVKKVPPTSSSDRQSKTGGKKQSTSKPCGSCGAAHDRSSCKFLDAVCRYCQIKGHIVKVCRKKKKDERNRYDSDNSDTAESVKSSRRSQHSAKSSHKVSSVYVLSANTFRHGDVPPHMVQVRINGLNLTGQLDNGADVTLISRHDYERIGSPVLVGSPTTARAANNEVFPLHGSFKAEATLLGRKKGISMHLADTTTTLFGRTFFKAFELNKIPLDDVICNFDVHESIAAVGTVQTHATSSKLGPCHSCGNQHSRAHCKFRKAVCYKCGRSGHIRKMCKIKSHPASKKPANVRTACAPPASDIIRVGFARLVDPSSNIAVSSSAAESTSNANAVLRRRDPVLPIDPSLLLYPAPVLKQEGFKHDRRSQSHSNSTTSTTPRSLRAAEQRTPPRVQSLQPAAQRRARVRAQPTIPQHSGRTRNASL